MTPWPKRGKIEFSKVKIGVAFFLWGQRERESQRFNKLVSFLEISCIAVRDYILPFVVRSICPSVQRSKYRAFMIIGPAQMYQFSPYSVITAHLYAIGRVRVNETEWHISDKKWSVTDAWVNERTDISIQTYSQHVSSHLYLLMGNNNAGPPQFFWRPKEPEVKPGLICNFTLFFFLSS